MSYPRQEVERRPTHPGYVVRLEWMNMQVRYDRWEVEHDPRALREAEQVEPVHV